MSQAIQTYYLNPTNKLDGRVKAVAQAGSVVIPWDDYLTLDDNHRAAAMALANKFNWLDYAEINGSGQLKDGSYVFTLGRKTA